MSAPSPATGALGLLRRVGRGLLRIPRARAPLPLLLWMALIFALSSARVRTLGAVGSFGFATNLAHAPLFGLLALWASLCLARRADWPVLERGGAAAVIAFAALYGILDETHQALVPGRDFSVLDVGTDVSAAFATLAVVRYVGRADAHARGLWVRLGAGFAACLAAAAISTWLPLAWPGVGWL